MKQSLDDIVIVEGSNELNIQMVPVAVPPGLANLYGKVTDAETGAPIVGMVGIYAGRIITTDADGFYSLTGLTPGSYTIKFDVVDYKTLIDEIAIVEGNNELNVELVPVVAPLPFTGFSLVIANPVAGAYYWFADFPYSPYTGKIGNRLTVNEAGWITQEAPGMDYIRVVFLDASYQCPASDPTCAGLIFYLLFEDGHHYILDCATGELSDNPSPPPGPPPPVEEPSLIDITIPSVASGEEFQVGATIYLPILRGDNQGWSFTLSPNGRKIRLYEALFARFLSPALKAVSGPVGQMFISLDRPDAIYSVQMKSSARYWPNRWMVDPLPPGSYPLTATASSIYYFWVPGPAGGLASSSIESFDLGIVGTLVVT